MHNLDLDNQAQPGLKNVELRIDTFVQIFLPFNRSYAHNLIKFPPNFTFTSQYPLDCHCYGPPNLWLNTFKKSHFFSSFSLNSFKPWARCQNPVGQTNNNKRAFSNKYQFSIEMDLIILEQANQSNKKTYAFALFLRFNQL